MGGCPRGPVDNRYDVRRKIASGGMGSILEVWDRELRRRLAMKVVRGHAEAADRVAWHRRQSRLRNEAQILGQLVYPGIIPVHDVGGNAGGELYFTMQFVKGQHLGEVIDGGDPEWTLTRLVGVLQCVCEAVAYAHSKGVLHRDQLVWSLPALAAR